jgi:hypothetical protein
MQLKGIAATSNFSVIQDLACVNFQRITHLSQNLTPAPARIYIHQQMYPPKLLKHATWQSNYATLVQLAILQETHLKIHKAASISKTVTTSKLSKAESPSRHSPGGCYGRL